MPAATWVEIGIVADARSTLHGELIDRIIETLEIEIVPVSVRQAEIARLACRRYGRGSGAPALSAQNSATLCNRRPASEIEPDNEGYTVNVRAA